MEVEAPAGTTGVVIPQVAGTYQVGNKKGQTGQYVVQGGSKVVIKQE